ncbi:MAG: ABC-2 family transporter protein, partial [Candidatus Latescibacteria bacterium]|nr:ABC-2 family transporter protein [Candidatus Latescibacterota bacterium]
ALLRLGLSVGLQHALGFGVTLLAGAAIVYSFWLILATLSFWFVRVEKILIIFQGVYEAGRWPVGIYPLWLQVALTALVPVAFAVTVPAEAVVGRLTGPMLGLALVLALALLVGARWFWKCGVKRYSGASA